MSRLLKKLSFGKENIPLKAVSSNAEPCGDKTTVLNMEKVQF